MDALDLVGLIASRICHDFAGPIGALSNGIELLADEQDADVRREFTTILSSTAANLAVRIRLYRSMVGSGADRDIVQSSEARGVLAGVLDAECKIALDWAIGDDVFTKAEERLLLSLAILGAEAMPRGGTLRVARVQGVWIVEAKGLRAALTSDMLAVLADKPLGDAGWRTALAHYAREAAARLGLAISIDTRESEIMLSAK